MNQCIYAKILFHYRTDVIETIDIKDGSHPEHHFLRTKKNCRWSLKGVRIFVTNPRPTHDSLLKMTLNPDFLQTFLGIIWAHSDCCRLLTMQLFVSRVLGFPE